MRLLLVVACAVAASAQAPTLQAVVANASRYVADYETRFSVLVAEERYVQQVRRQAPADGGNLSRNNAGGGFSGPKSAEQSRAMRSDYLLVRLQGGGGWMPFRDVFEVDGRRVHGRDDKLAKLFIQPTPSSFEQAFQIMAESNRYNVGSVNRTINIPILALLLIHPDNVSRFRFQQAGEETVANQRAWIIEFTETSRPTLIKTSPPGVQQSRPTEDLPVRGKMWINPDSGVILKTTLVASSIALHAEVTVTFGQDAKLSLWVPEQMQEVYRSTADDRDVVGTATYTNYRRFSVSTDEKIAKPPGR